MRKAAIYRNGVLAGILTEVDRQHFVFKYDDTYFQEAIQPAISLTLPKNQKEYNSEFLFPFFFNMLSEGVNRKLQCTQLRNHVRKFIKDDSNIKIWSPSYFLDLIEKLKFAHVLIKYW